MLRRTFPRNSNSKSMLSSTPLLLAPAIPRHTWDPTRHDPKWVDSVAKPIADRRAWSAKKWRIGIDPQTPREWLQFSLRNLAYEYNAAMRACETFPDIIPIYKEMKARGVKVDVDTMYVVLGRAARYEGMDPKDVFALFDELVQLGARPDIAVVEILHTSWDLAVGASAAAVGGGEADATWRELRRRDLVRWYHRLAVQDIRTYGGGDSNFAEQANGGLDKLMLSQLRRYRQNLQSLGSVLHTAVWVSVLAHVKDSDDLIGEVQAMMWERAPKDCKYAELTAPGGQTVTVPILGESLRRLIVSSSSSKNKNAVADMLGDVAGEEGGAAAAAEGSAEQGDQDALESNLPSQEALLGEQRSASAAVLAALSSSTAMSAADSSSSSSAAATAWSIEDEPLGDFLGDLLAPGFGDSFSAVTWRRCSSNTAVSSFEDFSLNRGVLAALERLVDAPFPVDEQTQSYGAIDNGVNGVALAIIAMTWRTGMLLSADVMAQALDIVRFNDAAANSSSNNVQQKNATSRREQDSVRYLRFALRATSMQARSPLSNAAVAMWRNNRCAVDDRVIARYVHCRDPWSDVVFCPQRGEQMFGAFSAMITAGGNNSAAAAEAGAGAGAATENNKEGADGESSAPSQQQQQQTSSSLTPSSATSNMIQERWNDVLALFDRFTSWNRRVRSTGSPFTRMQQQQHQNQVGDNQAPLRTWVLAPDAADGLGEVMTAAADFLLRMTLMVGVAASSAGSSTATSSGNSRSQQQLQHLRSLDQLFRLAAQLKRDIEMTCSVAKIETSSSSTSSSSQLEALAPSPECWECLLTVCRALMDHLVHSRSADLALQRDSDALFGQVSALRAQMLNEAKERYDGKLRMLWLQEI